MAQVIVMGVHEGQAWIVIKVYVGILRPVMARVVVRATLSAVAARVVVRARGDELDSRGLSSP